MVHANTKLALGSQAVSHANDNARRVMRTWRSFHYSVLLCCYSTQFGKKVIVVLIKFTPTL